MSKNSNSVWSSGLAINLTSNLIAAIVGGAVTYFAHEGSTWVKPLLFGSIAWLVTFISILAVRFMRRVPPRAQPITPENVGRTIRDWLDDFNLTVQTISDPDFHFLFIVTTDGGKRVSVFRGKKKFADYIEFQANLKQTEEEKLELAGWSEDEKLVTRLAIQLELSRAVMGYQYENMFEKIRIFRRIPITSSLTAEDISREICAVEAMIGSIYSVAAIGVHRHKANNKSSAKTVIQGGNGNAKELPHSDEAK